MSICGLKRERNNWCISQECVHTSSETISPDFNSYFISLFYMQRVLVILGVVIHRWHNTQERIFFSNKREEVKHTTWANRAYCICLFSSSAVNYCCCCFFYCFSGECMSFSVCFVCAPHRRQCYFPYNIRETHKNGKNNLFFLISIRVYMATVYSLLVWCLKWMKFFSSQWWKDTRK